MNRNIFAIAITALASLMLIACKSKSSTDTPVQAIHVRALPSFELTNRVTIFVRGDLGRLSIVLPEPVSNIYQDIVYMRSNYDVERLYVPGKLNKYTRRLITNDSLLNNIENRPTTFWDIYYVTPHEITVDFDKIKTIYPYNTNSVIYRRYTAPFPPYIEPQNPFILQMADRLWKSSDHDIIKYARQCYEETATYLTYENKRNMPPLGEVLMSRRGNCVDYSSMFISLLRAKHIPARHVAGLLTNHTRHSWAEFYLERYGWIPVDATFKNSNPQKDYFGRFDGYGIVTTIGLNSSYVMADEPKKITLPLHNHNVYYYSWPKTPNDSVFIKAKHNFNCRRY